MRWHGDWMTRLDERVLEHLDSEEPMTAWQIAYDLDKQSHIHVAKRCRVLARAEFLVRIPREGLEEQYDITGDGQRYLLGEINADHRRPLPAPRPPEAVRPGWYAGFG